MNGDFSNPLCAIAFAEEPKTGNVSLELLATVLARAVRLSPESVTRAELAAGQAAAPRPVDRRTLPQATLSKVVKRLTRFGLLGEGTPRRHGKRHYVQLLHLGEGYVTAAAHVVVAEGLPVAVTTALCDIAGMTCHADEFDYLIDRGDARWSELAVTVHRHVGLLLERVSERQGGVAPQLFGLGVELGAPVLNGTVTPIVDMTTFEPFPVDLQSELRQVFNGDFGEIPIVIENDAAALAALAVRERGYIDADLAVVTVFQDGVGGGLVMDGRVRRGQAGRAMEVGHLVVDCPPGWPADARSTASLRWNSALEPAKCPCGRRGHVDGISTPARIRKALEIPGADPWEVYTHAGAALGRALSNVCNVVAPSLLIVYVPSEIKDAPEGTAAAEYVKAADREVHMTFSADVPGATVVRFLALPDDPRDIALRGARGAAVCVLDMVVERALTDETPAALPSNASSIPDDVSAEMSVILTAARVADARG
ncbi:ROK family protein [Nocardia sp. NPDC057030]|uniref:ROK family protein n=1 Tax=unclassified Nocardia TaxID=2637762 RepID=UPI00363DF72A